MVNEVPDQYHARGAEPPLDLTHCWSCRRSATSGAIVVLVILTSPRGPYALCIECAGRDIQRPTGETPVSRAMRKRRETAAGETLSIYQGEAR